MSCYCIGIGGTGAKCVEALTHLCAAGLMRDGELFTLFVDPDKANGSVGRAQVTLRQYAACMKLDVGAIDLFKTTLIVSEPDVWSPFANESRPSLDEFFQYHNLKGVNPAAANLFDVLYSPLERTTTLEKGFRGHPSIGAAVMAERVQLGEEEPWKTLRHRMANDLSSEPGPKVFLIGSIFGGTGAAGFPTIARFIGEEFKANGRGGARRGTNLGGALMLPYFSFIPDDNSCELRASSESFLMSTQAALKYYFQQNSNSAYDSIYLLGDDTLSTMKQFSVGSSTQRNEPHFIETFAALAAIDFFKAEAPAGFPMIARHRGVKIEWRDLPDGSGGNAIRDKLGQLSRFAFAYLAVYHPMLEDIRLNGLGFRAPWYVDYFERGGLSVQDGEVQKEMTAVKDYCAGLLAWLSGIHGSATEQTLEMINCGAFADGFDLAQFGNLVMPETHIDAHGLTRVWKRLCQRKLRDRRAQGFGRFIRALYDACALAG